MKTEGIITDLFCKKGVTEILKRTFSMEKEEDQKEQQQKDKGDYEQSPSFFIIQID